MEFNEHLQNDWLHPMLNLSHPTSSSHLLLWHLPLHQPPTHYLLQDYMSHCVNEHYSRDISLVLSISLFISRWLQFLGKHEPLTFCFNVRCGEMLDLKRSFSELTQFILIQVVVLTEHSRWTENSTYFCSLNRSSKGSKQITHGHSQRLLEMQFHSLRYYWIPSKL